MDLINEKNNKKKIFTYGIIIFILISVIVYIGISAYNLIPYLMLFLNGQYNIDTNDLPTYKEVFSNIFVGLGVIASSLFSYLLYKNSEQVRIQSSRAEANKIFFQYKSCIILMTLYYLEEKIDCICFDTEDGEALKKRIENKFGLPEYDSQTYYDFQSSIGNIAAHIKEVDSKIEDLDIDKMFSMNMYFYRYLRSDYTIKDCPIYLNKKLQKLNIDNKLSANKIYAWLWGFIIENDMRLLDDTYSRILYAILETSK